MTNVFSFGIALRRVYDSEPLEEKAVFFHETGIFSPLEKPGGLYVFINQPIQPVTIRCPGYLELQIEPQFQKRGCRGNIAGKIRAVISGFYPGMPTGKPPKSGHVPGYKGGCCGFQKEMKPARRLF